MRIGIICPSEIAFRRFAPALSEIPDAEFVGIGVCSKQEYLEDSDRETAAENVFCSTEREKAKRFVDMYGGKIYDSYEAISSSDDIEALYVPLPPALHFKWAKFALEHGKHVLVEKPSTLRAIDTMELVKTAEKFDRALHENYMFIFHKQLDAIERIIASGEIGDIRLYRISFGFPIREADDFRYSKKLGGGALIDACGYTIKYATRLLGSTSKIVYAQMNDVEGYEVDMYGSGALVNESGVTAQIAYGMDNNYKCELEAWGSKGCLTTGRVLTAPAGYKPKIIIRKGNKDEIRELPDDNAFKKSIEFFINCIERKEIREENYNAITKQAEMVDQFRAMAGNRMVR